MTIKNNYIVLDCTLRDGGYYNNWDFSSDIVHRYLKAISTSGVNVIEIGFRFMPKGKFMGGFAYCTDSFISTLPLPADCTIGVMLNAKDLLTYQEGQAAAIDYLFAPADQSPVEFVRIAAHVKDVIQCEDSIKRLTDLGYKVGVNIMQASLADYAELTHVARELSGWQRLTVLYFADSLGNMHESDVLAIIEALRKGWKGALGFHAHNNMGQALTNALYALKMGVTWVDATINGMGRGAGNAQLEYLLLELFNNNLHICQPNRIFDIAVNTFGRLKTIYKWGHNLFYYLAGLYKIHPTYVQQMLTEGYECNEIIAAIEILGERSSRSYSSESFQNAITAAYTKGEGAWSAQAWAKDKTILMIGAGEKLKRYKEALLHFIDCSSPIVLCLNYTDLIPPDKITAFVSCHPTRMLSLLGTYKRLKRPLITPIEVFSEQIKEGLSAVEVYDYGLSLGPDIIVRDKGCTVLQPLVAAYALSICIMSEAERVLLAGFDGYPSGDARNIEIDELFRNVKSLKPELPLIAITPTDYSISQQSIYEPGL